MSLLQWVKSGFGLGRRHTSETTPLSPETFGTYEGRPEILHPTAKEEEFDELYAAKAAFEGAIREASEILMSRVGKCGYGLVTIRYTTKHTAYERNGRHVMTALTDVNAEVEVTPLKAEHPVLISL